MDNQKHLIAVDLDGGDKAPNSVIRGIELAIKHGLVEVKKIVALGTEETVRLAQNKIKNVLCLVAEDKINMSDSAIESRKKKLSTIYQGILGLANKKFSAFVSMGNTAGIIAIALEQLKRIAEVRPAIAVPLPNVNGPCLLLDAGALHSVKPQSLLDYAHLGLIYVKNVWSLKHPVVKLINIGEESNKGDLLLTSAYELLAQDSLINFGGNIEPDRIFTEPVNIIICPGLLGNLIIKTGEGVLDYLRVRLGLFWKMLSLFYQYQKYIDNKKIGGAICLGFDGIVIIGHGKSDAWAIANALYRAQLEIEFDIVNKIKEHFQNK